MYGPCERTWLCAITAITFVSQAKLRPPYSRREQIQEIKGTVSPSSTRKCIQNVRERNGADNLPLRPNHDSESVSPPRRGNRLPVLINVPVLDGVSEEGIARNITVSKADAEMLDSRVSCVLMVRRFRGDWQFASVTCGKISGCPLFLPLHVRCSDW